MKHPLAHIKMIFPLKALVLASFVACFYGKAFAGNGFDFGDEASELRHERKVSPIGEVPASDFMAVDFGWRGVYVDIMLGRGKTIFYSNHPEKLHRFKNFAGGFRVESKYYFYEGPAEIMTGFDLDWGGAMLGFYPDGGYLDLPFINPGITLMKGLGDDMAIEFSYNIGFSLLFSASDFALGFSPQLKFCYRKFRIGVDYRQVDALFQRGYGKHFFLAAGVEF